VCVCVYVKLTEFEFITESAPMFVEVTQKLVNLLQILAKFKVFPGEKLILLANQRFFKVFK